VRERTNASALSSYTDFCSFEAVATVVARPGRELFCLVVFGEQNTSEAAVSSITRTSSSGGRDYDLAEELELESKIDSYIGEQVMFEEFKVT